MNIKGANSTIQVALLSVLAAITTLVLKFYAFYITNSVGLLSDALESFVNLFSGILTFIALYLAAIPADHKHPYGHDKAEYFSSGAEGVMIVVASFGIFYSVVSRLLYPEELQIIYEGLISSILATVINVITAFLMLKVAKKYDSIALESNAKHLISDVWTTVCVLISLLLIKYVSREWYFLDIIIALVVAFNILLTGIKIVKRSIDGLMDVTLPDNELQVVMQSVSSLLNDDNLLYGLRSRKSGNKRFIEFSIKLPANMTVDDSHAICDAIEENIGANLANAIITIHVEPLGSCTK